ncbi:MAG TPA: preprotein translocase subunit SecE [Candidatus Saccharimonadia bacterium]
MKPIINYFVASRAELAKVTWPTRRQTVRLTGMVIVFSLVFAALLGALDFAFQFIIQKLIIKG